MGEGAKRVTTLMGGNTTFQKRARGSTRTAFSPSLALGEVVALQRDRWIQWLAPALIVGAALWLLAPTDPPWWLALAVIVPSGAAAIGLAIWPSETADGWDVRVAYTRTEQALTPLCEEGRVILSRAPSPADTNCAAAQIIDANNLAQHGGGFIYLEDGSLRIERAWPSSVRRVWTPRTPAGDQE